MTIHSRAVPRLSVRIFTFGEKVGPNVKDAAKVSLHVKTPNYTIIESDRV